MATQPVISTMARLLAVTILTSICAIAANKSSASETSDQLASDAMKAVENGQKRQGSFSADDVAEARWARPQGEYALGDAGRIVAERRSADSTKPSLSLRFKDVGRPWGNQDYFDGVFSNGRLERTTECGPSPAPPEEITRLVAEAAERHEVDVGFAIAIATAESRLDRLRNSSKGARGPMQLMPETAVRFGVRDICDPAENVDGGVRYLRALVDEFRNPLLVAAAYNAGEGRVREHGGIPPFKETLGYVAKVLNIQMRLEGSGPIERERSTQAGHQQSTSSISGVITSHERRQWIGGVMHF
jgi:hypothetical protein